MKMESEMLNLENIRGGGAKAHKKLLHRRTNSKSLPDRKNSSRDFRASYLFGSFTSRKETLKFQFCSFLKAIPKKANKQIVEMFQMESTRKRSASTPAEESPIGLLFNDVGVKALMEEIQDDDKEVGFGKMFLTSLKGLMSQNSPEESAKDIYDRARRVWLSDGKLIPSCFHAIEEEQCLSDTLLAFANRDAPEQRMASMMKDPWLDYILGDHVLGGSSDEIIRGFLSVLIAYWNMRDLLDKYHLNVFRRDKKFIYLEYTVDHFQDFVNLKEELDTKFGSDPDLVGRLFEQICRFQTTSFLRQDICPLLRPSRIVLVLVSVDSGPLNLSHSFSFKQL